ncbi:hypothetical protein [Flavisphingomonas formosensis]|uniref:hypothetical protein n=1 Tax=Flavisphingomonas formosensis TaxID=861534 RepID=UPI0012FA56DA|nr:hypothetical protein [Sphingomonas formosensis]
MRRALLVLALAAGLAGCKTLGSPATAGQTLFAAVGTYKAAVIGATTYAESPDASPAVVKAATEANRAVQPAVKLADAYRLCTTGAASVGGTPCASFDFSTANLLAVTTQIRDAAAKLQER